MRRSPWSSGRERSARPWRPTESPRSTIHAFEEKYDQSFGADAQLSPRNLVDPRRVEIKTADVTIKVDPDRTDLVQTRIINGVKYILVRVEEGVEVNGVPVQITE